MINKLKILGEYVLKNEGDTNSFGLNVALNEANVIILEFTLDNEKCNFIGFDTIEFDQTKNNKILYKNAGGQAKSPFATYNAFFNKDETESKANIQKSLKKFTATISNNAKINHKLKEILNFLEIDGNILLLEEGIFERLSAEKSNLFTIKINGLHIGDSPFFQPILEHYRSSKDEEYFSKYNKISIGKDIHCYTCGNISEKLYGFCDTFKFYSANEPAYIAGGFKQNKTWKNYPVCPICANYLRIAREKLNKNLNRYFYGNKYFLIPSPTLDKGDFYENLLDIEDQFKDLSLSKGKEKNQQLRNELEEEIFETLSKQKDQATFTFFFYKASNSEFKILQEAEDILPSRFQKIIVAKIKVEKFDEFKNLKGLYKKGELHNLSFNFGIIKTFFPSNFNNDFLDITAKILKGQKMSKSFITHQISEHLSQGFRNEALYHDIKKAMIFLKFLYELNLIEKTRGKMEVTMENKYQNYFQKHPKFYDADWKKAVFLTGVLAQHVMDIQYQDRKATPFRSRLNGLKLDARAIKRLLPESIEKLEQYKSNYYRDLETTISLLMESGEPELKNQSVDEISFYFAMGMNLNKQFKNKKEEKGEENE
ncbi:MAG: TIGR02556 family CRISPR-associated protein [FCB group bacterium]|nr:TIGR02556 family CRISPR-associated protein [FCB group bacterium]